VAEPRTIIYTNKKTLGCGLLFGGGAPPPPPSSPLTKTLWGGAFVQGRTGSPIHVYCPHGFRGQPKIVGQRLIVIFALASSVNSVKLSDV
jgi:hypothetical protein